MKRVILACALALAWHAHVLAQEPLWRFTVYLDDEPIGTHDFTTTSGPDGIRSLRSDADFRVRILGVPVYRYQHRAQEQWRGNCLQALDAQTDDGGERSRVQLHKDDRGGLQLRSPQGGARLSGCIMSFAYWNPALRTQTTLLNAQTGAMEQVRWERMESAPIAAHGEPVDAVRWRVSGTKQPLDVWWTEDGRWVGLDATVRGGRRLSYRLR
ncbi:MAG: hypothetical protein JSS56_20355 [Proteobacteria bacterium]|nr:hypothetical protein [Pseudomonadota bacterium]